MHGVCLHEHDILSVLLLLVNVSGLGSPSSHMVLTCTAGFIVRISSQATASSAEVRAEAGFRSEEVEILAQQVADVECLSQLPGKEEGFDLALRLSSSLSQLVMSGGKETNMKHFFKGQAYPSHEFILSSPFSGKKGAKVQLCSLRSN